MSTEINIDWTIFNFSSKDSLCDWSFPSLALPMDSRSQLARVNWLGQPIVAGHQCTLLQLIPSFFNVYIEKEILL